MNMRSRKKKFYWGAERRRIPSQFLTKLKSFDITNFRKEIGLNVMRVFGSNTSVASNWFNTPAIALNGLRPLDLLANGNIAALHDYLIRLEHCVYM